MKVWELRNAAVNEMAPLTYGSDEEMRSGMFDAKGLPLTWLSRPSVEYIAEPRKKKQKPRADVSVLRPGALVLNPKARDALAAFLTQFGQLLEMSCEGDVRFFYNVTNVVDCIDPENSERRSSGSIVREVFFEDKVPSDAAIFKDPVMARTRIYANEAAKAIVDKLVADACITGLMFTEPGAESQR